MLDDTSIELKSNLIDRFRWVEGVTGGVGKLSFNGYEKLLSSEVVEKERNN